MNEEELKKFHKERPPTPPVPMYVDAAHLGPYPAWADGWNAGYMSAADRIVELEAVVESLRDLAGHAYIFCGVHDAPELWLDVMFAGSSGEDFTTEGLLPYTPLARPDDFTKKHGVDLRGIKVGEPLTQEQWDSVTAFVREQERIIDAYKEQARPDGGAAVGDVYWHNADGDSEMRVNWYGAPPAVGSLIYTHPDPAPDVAQVVDDAMVERASAAYWNDASGNRPHPNPWPEGAEPLADDIRKGMRAALIAAQQEDSK